MKCTRIGWFLRLLVAVVLIGSQPGLAAGSSKAALEKDNVAKLSEMSPQQVKALDLQLSEALSHYYNEDFQRALPLFEDVSDTIETLDLMFWIGTSAAKTGQHDLSIEKYRQMLEIDPQLHRVRLELADVLYQTDRLEEARRELETVKASSPPAAVMMRINQRLRAIGNKAEKFQWGASLSTGYQYDDNIGAGPGEREIPWGAGTLKSSKVEEGHSWLVKLGANARYDIGESRGLMWSGGLDVYSSYNTSGNTEFSYMATDLSTGPLWIMPKAIFRLPFGFRNTQYGQEHLSDTFHIDPKMEVFITKQIALKTGWTYAKENYAPDNRRANDNTLNVLSLGPSVYLKEGKHVVSGTFVYENRDADSDLFSYETTAWELSYFGRFPSRMELVVRYRGMERMYEAPTFANQFNDDRIDRRHTLSAAISKRFLKRYFASLGYVYMENTSNAELYSFTKNIVTLDVGITF